MHYGCSTSRNKGLSVYANRKTIRRDRLEQAVLGALKTTLIHDVLANCFSEEYARRLDELRCAGASIVETYRAERDKLAKERKNILAALRNSISVSLIKDELERVTLRLNELNELLTHKDTDALPHPRTVSAERYWAVIDTLVETLNSVIARTVFHEGLRRSTLRYRSTDA